MSSQNYKRESTVIDLIAVIIRNKKNAAALFILIFMIGVGLYTLGRVFQDSEQLLRITNKIGLGNTWFMDKPSYDSLDKSELLQMTWNIITKNELCLNQPESICRLQGDQIFFMKNDREVRMSIDLNQNLRSPSRGIYLRTLLKDYEVESGEVVHSEFVESLKSLSSKIARSLVIELNMGIERYNKIYDLTRHAVDELHSERKSVSDVSRIADAGHLLYYYYNRAKPYEHTVQNRVKMINHINRSVIPFSTLPVDKFVLYYTLFTLFLTLLIVYSSDYVKNNSLISDLKAAFQQKSS